jgi:hypothetical protein
VLLGRFLPDAAPEGQPFGSEDTPFLLVDRNFPSLSANFVGSNDIMVGELATHHRINLGRRRIAHIGGQDMSPSRDRPRAASADHPARAEAHHPAVQRCILILLEDRNRHRLSSRNITAFTRNLGFDYVAMKIKEVAGKHFAGLQERRDLPPPTTSA